MPFSTSSEHRKVAAGNRDICNGMQPTGRYRLRRRIITADAYRSLPKTLANVHEQGILLPKIMMICDFRLREFEIIRFLEDASFAILVPCGITAGLPQDIAGCRNPTSSTTSYPSV